jgi:uncharacterized protein
VVLAGCETAPTKPEQGEYTTGESGIQQAERYLREAGSLESPEKDIALLNAAGQLSKEGLSKRALAVLRQIDGNALPDDKFIQFSLMGSELALERNSATDATRFLESKRLQTLSASFTPRQRGLWYKIQGFVQEAEGNYHKAVFFYARASALATDRTNKRELHDQVWKALNRQTREELELNRDLSNDADVVGWYELALATRGNLGDLTLQIESIEHWQSRHPNHPAVTLLPETLQGVLNIPRDIPSRIAIFLPSNDTYRLASESVTEGMMAAYYRSLGRGGSVPELIFYDTDSADIPTLYQRALMEGANLVIGPLRREKLEDLMALPELAIPVLALNVAEDRENPHPNLFQFGLSVDDEARQIAEFAWQRGFRAAMVITPDTRWGYSARDTFSDLWQSQGGAVVAATTYNQKQTDYAALLEPAFFLQHSRQRAQRLRQTLGKNIAYNPSRRKDLDMIFLLANAQSGQQIKPSLDYLYAADLPVFATSMINDGRADRALYSDLNGIMFTALPWSVPAYDRNSLKPGSNLPSAYRNLFALGVDAYNINQWLTVLKSMPHADIRGQTGELNLAANNRIVRTLPWGQFVDGRAVPLHMATESE